MTKCVVCLTAVAKPRDAHRIAETLVKERLAACVNVVPGAVSFYRWKNKLRRDHEVLMIMKTAASKTAALEKRLRKLHPYELPEFVVLPIRGGFRNYLRWIAQSL